MMEQIMLWVTIFGIIVIPLVGWAINTLITKKIDELGDNQEKLEALFFRKLDSNREDVEKNYVRRDLYEQAMNYHNDKNDAEFKSLLTIMNTQFLNVEAKIDDLKTLINEKMSGKNVT